MRPKYIAIAVLMVAGVWLFFGMVSCGSGNDEMTDIVRYYHEMKAVGLNGLVDRFLSMRDSVTNAYVDTYYTWRGWEMDSAKVYQMAFGWPDIAGLPLVQDSISGRWRRLVFRQCGLHDEKNRELCMFPVILLGKNGDQWKISNVYRIAWPRYREDGSERTVDGLNFHKLFQLPPSFEDLVPREGEPMVPEMQKIPVDPKTGKPIYQP